MFITNHQGNTNQNHKIPLHTHQNGYYQKKQSKVPKENKCSCIQREDILTKDEGKDNAQMKENEESCQHTCSMRNAQESFLKSSPEDMFIDFQRGRQGEREKH